VIHVHNLLTAAQSSFDGSQWGAQADLGGIIPSNACYIAPFFRLKYDRLQFDDYTEHGAYDLNLSVITKEAIEFLGGAGIRIAKGYEFFGIAWLPEVVGFVGYDFHNDGEETFADFVSVGPAFSTHGITPGRTVIDGSVALNGVYGQSIFTAKYNVEWRNQFVANTGYLEYRWSWA
jgi:outer membrane autotransporter protein